MNHKLITIFEDIQEKCELTPEQKAGILELKDIIGNQNVISQTDTNLLVKKYVGFFASKNIKLQILPKIFSEEKKKDDDQIKTSVSLFIRLLHYTKYSKLKNIPPISTTSHESNLLEIFIDLLINNFLLQFNRSINRDYIKHEENLIFIKGKILFGKSIVKNSFLTHKNYCEFDEFTEDNLLNRIFKSTFSNLLQISESADNKKLLKLSLTYLENVGKINLSKEVFEKVKFTRLNENYRPIFNLARMFYNNSQPGFRDGDELTFSYLIPLNLLFEFFVFKLVRKSLIKESYRVLYQKPTKNLACNNDEKVLYQRPDIVVKIGDETIMILDAKYTNLFKDKKFNPSDANVYQLLSYAINYNCKNLFIVSPYYLGGEKIDELKSCYVIKNNNNDIKLKFIQLDITQNSKNLIMELKNILIDKEIIEYV